ncbi:MAG: helix-turn-helix domain-containing protein [Bacteroidetes bacterium]|nr:MAG: helix-turn-helix domain-containing protein [Bacteroidota bacterium]
MPMSRHLLPIILLFTTCLSWAQAVDFDSLYAVLRTQRDTNRINSLRALGWGYWQEDRHDSARHYAQLVIEEAVAFPPGLADGHYLMAISYTNDYAYEKAIDWYEKALAIYKRYDLPLKHFYLYLNVGSCFTLLDRYEEAILRFDSARLYLDPTEDDHRLRWAEVMGLFYDHQREYEQALRYRLIGWQEARAHASPDLQLYRLYDLAYQFETLDQHDSAIHYLQLALPLVDSTQNSTMEWSVKACLGICWIEKAEYSRGLAYLEEAEVLAKNLETALCCGNTAYHAKALVMVGRAAEAAPYLAKARNQLHQIEDDIDRRNVLQAFYDVYKATAQYDSAMVTLEQLMELKDHITERTNRKAIADMEVRYATQAKEHQIVQQATQLSKQRILLWCLTFGLLLSVSLVILYRRYYLEKQRTAALLAEHNEKLQQLDAAKSRFFANVSHEFRTPLNLIIGPLEEAIDYVRELSLRKQLIIARRNASQLLGLVEELLDISRLRKGKLTLHLKAVQLLPRLNRLLESYRSVAMAKSIRLQTDFELEEELTVLLDGPKFDKIINNLIGNALNFTPAGGSVQCVATWNMDHLEVQVHDDGPGISATDLPYIFERYYQGSAARNPRGGTGIGLALSRELAQAMAGSLTVSSEEGLGSTFVLRLPLQQTMAVMAVSLEGPTIPYAGTDYQSPHSPERPALLVIEDQVDMQQYIHHILSPHFYTHIVGDAESGLRCLERKSFELILSDLMLPGMNGLALLQHIRESKTVFCNIPFLILTARVEQEKRLYSMDLGADDYLNKPFQAEELIARLRNIWTNYHNRQQSRQDNTERSAADIFLQQVESLVQTHLADSSFNVKILAQKMAQSQRNLERMIKLHTGLTPAAFIREIRLRKAYQLLHKGVLASVSEVGHATGFPSAAHFSRIFSQRFGVSPKEVRKVSQL